MRVSKRAHFISQSSYRTDPYRMRNLSRSELGGVIFGCTKRTMGECLTKQLFGLPASHFVYVQHIEEGMPLFLFNYSQRQLYGIYEAASWGQMNIDPYAWTEDGSERTQFPAQVRVRLRLECQGLAEFIFKPFIIDNYYTQSHFWFELDRSQVSQLISKLSSLATAPRPSMNQQPQLDEVVQRFSVDENEVETISNSCESSDELHLSNSVASSDEQTLILEKLEKLSLLRENSEADGIDCIAGATSTGDEDIERKNQNQDKPASIENPTSSFDFHQHPSIVEKLCLEIQELKVFKQLQTETIHSLQKKLAKAEAEIARLENVIAKQRNYEPSFELNESILIIGGTDGEDFLSSFNAFSTSHDFMRSLRSLSTARAYASVVIFNEEIYVFGGTNGSSYYNTVESYNLARNEWLCRPSLNKSKGSLGGAAVNGKLFAIGGGNGVECFSDVEMFDPYIGRWTDARSMLQKRFTVNAVELNGAIYAVGGFDGNNYLSSTERFDPREHHWSRIASMNAGRGCHALVTMNQKLYAIGGYNGVDTIPSTEVYDPRIDSWTMGETMNKARGYHSAAVLNNTIYVIGGVEGDDQEIVEQIECYREGGRWERTNLKAVGKRCFASAIVLESGGS